MQEPWQFLRHRGAAEAEADICPLESPGPGLEKNLQQECCSSDIFGSYPMEADICGSCWTANCLHCLSAMIKASA